MSTTAEQCGASASTGVDARVGHCGSVSERQRPVSLKMNWKPPVRFAVVDTHGNGLMVNSSVLQVSHCQHLWSSHYLLGGGGG